MKHCTKCGEPKQLDQFHKDKHKPDGHAPACKSCKTAYDLARYPTVRGKTVARAARWYQENTEQKRNYDASRRENGEDKTKMKRCPVCDTEALMRPGIIFCSIKCRGLAHYNDQPTYSGMHQRMRSLKGDASWYICVDCDSLAEEWSYDGLDDDSLTDDRSGCKYSVNPDHYEARCRSCHRKYDIGWKDLSVHS